MKLYELPRGSFFTVDNGELLNTLKQPVYFLDHIDGAYSYCTDSNNKVVHWSASTPVKVAVA